MTTVFRIVLLAGWLTLAWIAAPVGSAEVGGAVFSQGDALLQRGDFRGALDAWEHAQQSLEPPTRQSVRPVLLLRRGEALRRLGRIPEAAAVLREAIPLVSSDPEASAALAISLGTVLLAAGSHAEAEQYIQQGLTGARAAGSPRIEANAFNALGQLHVSREDFPRALDAYRESSRIAAGGSEHALQVQALINAARAAERLQDSAGTLGYLAEAEPVISRMTPGFDRTLALLAAAQLRIGLAGVGAAGSALAPVHAMLHEALDLARGNGDMRSESYAWGYLAQLYLQQDRLVEALDLNGRAVFAADRVGASESSYRWHWQRGRILRGQAENAAAVEAYRRALAELQSIRPDLNAAMAAAQTSFRDSLGPVFLELADLLLHAARNAGNRDTAQKLLLEARGTLELSKAAELEDYFKDGCIAAMQARTAGVTSIDKRTAVIYPILLSDRVELLVAFPDGIRQYSVPVEGRAVATVARQFRYRLEWRTTRHFMENAQRLYDWLVRPMEGDLAGNDIDTLVFVPESALRAIPMSALHDGRQFLIHRYAIAVTPGLTLTDPRPLGLGTRQAQALLTGLSEPVQGFAALPDVKSEIAAIQNIQGGRVLLDQQYVLPNVEQEFLREALSIVHVASHGEFHGDAKRTFLLTFDGKLTMDNLERLIAPSRFRDRPIELLTLSACETAAGDDRAALGLAGVAVKAGARSALASLWSINDESTAMLIEEFYRGLKQGLSKAKALQQAQGKLIVDLRFRHPGYWAPFLLIGNWL